MLSVIIPAFNEERCLPETLARLDAARQHLANATELLVVDNNSTDGTPKIAASMGATVIREDTRNIARVRNRGAQAARGELLVFVDADVLVPVELLERIHDLMSDARCAGGAVDTDYRPRRSTLKVYLQVWRVLGKMLRMAQGATLFCRRDVFQKLGGFDETIYMGEDVDFFWRMRRLARKDKLRVRLVDDVRVQPSCRRFDSWPLWRTLVWTNPLVIIALQRNPHAWRGWYRSGPR